MTWKEWDAGWTYDMDPKERERRDAICRATLDAQGPSNHRVDEQGCSINWNEIHDELYEVVDDILEKPTKSLADLGLQLQAFALAENHTWTDEDDHPQVNRWRLQSVIQGACDLCGVAPLAGAEKFFASDEDEEAQS